MRGRYTVIGFLVSKLVMPLVRRKVRKRVRGATVGNAKAGASAARNNPGRSSVAIGSAAGAAAYLVKRKRNKRGRTIDLD